jgi:hypothetical protein
MPSSCVQSVVVLFRILVSLSVAQSGKRPPVGLHVRLPRLCRTVAQAQTDFRTMVARMADFLDEAPREQASIVKQLESIVMNLRTRKLEYNLGRTLSKSKVQDCVLRIVFAVVQFSCNTHTAPHHVTPSFARERDTVAFPERSRQDSVSRRVLQSHEIEGKRYGCDLRCFVGIQTLQCPTLIAGAANIDPRRGRVVGL